jgi:hypothetical protein
MIGVQVQHYRDRARDFLDGMKYLQDDLEEFGYSTALLGIHGSLSYCDALRAGLGSSSLSSDDHSRAADELRSLLAVRKFERLQGADRLKKLLGKKSRIAYSRDAADKNEIKQILQHALRFAEWAEETGKILRIEGWRDE